MDMICFMHEGTPYGVLKVGSKVILPSNLASMVGATLQDVEGWLEELESVHVFDRDENGAIMSRRMIRDENTRELRAAGGKLGGNPALKQGKVNLHANLGDNIKSETKVKQKPTPSSSSSFSSSSSSSISSTQEEKNSSATADESDFFSQAEITPKKETVSSEGVNFARWFRDTLPEKTNMPDKWEKSFAQTYDDLVRLDGRNDAEIKRVCQWARNDSFWCSNFQSPAKLRKRNKDGIQYYDVFLEKAHQVKRSVQKGTIENIQLKILNGPDKNV
jgi:hypothetical protein